MNPFKKSYRDPAPSVAPAPPSRPPRALASSGQASPEFSMRKAANAGPRENEPDFAEEFDRGTGMNDPVEDREWAEKTGAR